MNLGGGLTALAVAVLMSGAAFSPKSLFAAGEQGSWYDPSDLSSMTQDSAGTIPAAVGQPVGKILDKSGRGNHATQSTSTSRPLLQQDANGKYYLSFDGFDDFLVTGSISFTSTDKMTVWAGLYKASDATGFLAELSASAAANVGTFNLYSSVGNPRAELRGDAAAPTALVSNIAAAPLGLVISTYYDIAGAARATEIFPRVNGAIPALSTGGGADAGTGNFGNYALYIGRRGGSSNPLNGRIYSLIVRGAASTSPQISAAERYIAKKMGITL